METTAVLLNGRNDDYKEDERFVACINSMLETFDEVWYCDWNSPLESGSLLWKVEDQIPKTGRLRHYVIDPETALLLTNNDPKVGGFSYILPQNLMLKRCTADWIVSSALDIIPPKKEYFKDFISKANKDTFYTVSRRDVEYSELEKDNFNWRKFRDRMDEISQPRYFPTKITPNDNYSIINCCGDFQLAHKDIWHTIRGFEEQMVYACFQDTNIQKKAVLNKFNLQAYYDLPLYHLSHKGMGNDGSSPSKQVYNSALKWVEYFNKSENLDTWGFSPIKIEYEII